MKRHAAKSRVLVVDDDPGVLSIMRDLLTADGYEVMTAANGRQALALAEDFQPHLAIVDVRMPLMDGYEILRHLRAKRDLRAIVISGYADLCEVIAKGEDDAAADAYFPKPVPWRQMRESVRYLLAEVAAPKQSSSGSPPCGG